MLRLPASGPSPYLTQARVGKMRPSVLYCCTLAFNLYEDPTYVAPIRLHQAFTHKKGRRNGAETANAEAGNRRHPRGQAIFFGAADQEGLVSCYFIGDQSRASKNNFTRSNAAGIAGSCCKNKREPQVLERYTCKLNLSGNGGGTT